MTSNAPSADSTHYEASTSDPFLRFTKRDRLSTSWTQLQSDRAWSTRQDIATFQVMRSIIDAMHLILSSQLLPALRHVISDLGDDDVGTLVHTRPTATASGYPTNSPAAVVHHLNGVLTSWGAACLGAEEVTRDRDREFEYDGPVLPELDRLADLVARLPRWVAAAERRGEPAEATGTAYPVENAKAAGTLTTEWVLAHILHDVAGHLGHVEVTRDVLLAARGGHTSSQDRTVES